MSSFKTLTAAELRAVLNLHAELAEWDPQDRAGRMSHLLNGVERLLHTTNAYVFYLQQAPSDGSSHAKQGSPAATWQVRDDVSIAGLEDWQRRLWQASFLLDEQYRRHPLYTETINQAGRHRTFVRRELLSDRDWYRSPFVAEVLHALGYDDSLISILPLCDGLEVSLGVAGVRGEPPFDDRQQSILQVLQSQLAWLYRADEETRRPKSKIARLREQLPPRLMETHDLLLTAKSEKQIASCLGVSARTAHKYIERVYRFLGVQSRAELMVQWLEHKGGSPEST